MNPTLDARAKAVFDAIIDLAAGEQATALDEACGDDRELKQRVQDLLHSDSKTDFVQRIVGRAAHIATPKVDQVDRTPSIERYRLIGRIAGGGMGEVYEGQQLEPIERPVAIKLIRSELASDDIIRRFETERQSLSLMTHPAIATVFDAGTADDGRPFFAMELVEGIDIDRYCDQQGLSIERRLKLLLAVSAGVQHAHQKGIVHRDLKPSNVLVKTSEQGPQPKIIDFGIAKALDPMTAFGQSNTIAGSTLGTPEYMSPEQAGLPRAIDTRTDVYSLGVLLYQLMVGSRPFRSKDLRNLSIDAAKHLIREQPIERLSQRAQGLDPSDSVFGDRALTQDALIRRLRGDLEWICERATAKEPDDRYASVSDFARDLERHLAKLPVSAGPPTLRYRATKAIQRHRGLAAAVAVAVAAVGVGITGLTTGLAKARSAQQATEIEAERTSKTAAFLGTVVTRLNARDLGDAIIDELHAAVEDRNGSDAQTQFNSLIDGVNRADTARAVLGQQVLAPARESAEQEFSSDPAVLSSLLLTIGTAYRNLSLFEPAEDAMRESVRLRTESLGAEARSTLNAKNELANLLRRRGKLDEALELHNRNLELRRQTLGAGHKDTLGTLTNLGTLHSHRREYALAFDRWSEATEGKRKLYGDDSPEVVRMQYAMGTIAARLHRYQEAIALLSATAVAQTEQFGADHQATLATNESLASTLHEAGRYQESEALFTSVLAHWTKNLGEDHTTTLLGHDLFAYVLIDLGRFEEARAIFERTIAGHTRNIGPNSEITQISKAAHAVTFSHTGPVEQAQRGLTETLSGVPAELGPDHPTFWPMRRELAFAHYRAGDWQQAVADLEQLITFIETAMAKDTEEYRTATTLPYRTDLARALLGSNQPEKMTRAHAMLTKAVPEYVARFGSDRAMSARAIVLEAQALVAISDDPAQQEQALNRTREAITALESVFGADTYPVADSYLRWAIQLEGMGDTAAALRLRQRGAAADPVSPLLR